jgi:hypothetical protein
LKVEANNIDEQLAAALSEIVKARKPWKWKELPQRAGW